MPLLPTAPRRTSSTVVALAAVAAAVGALLAPALAPAPAVAAALPTAPDGAPQVIPALTGWEPAATGFGWTTQSRIVTDGESADDARLLADELGAVLGRTVEVSVGAEATTGDISLDRDPAQEQRLGRDGYELVSGATLEITGAQAPGVFYGTRTALQLLTRSTVLPGGTAVDVPEFSERGAGVCACQIQISPDFFERLMKDMAYTKLNQLWIETKLESQAHPEANFWAYYTSEQGRELQAIARKYHITLIPEVNSPGHMGPWLANYPELQLTDRFGRKQPTRLDITEPEALDFVTDIIDEYFLTFDGPYWHMGADEYMLGSAYADYPQIRAYMDARPDEYGPDAVPEDVYIDFINKVNAHVKSLGKQLRVWNDGIPKVATHEVDKDVVIEFWDGRDNLVQARDILARGYDLQNASYSLYLIRSPGTGNPLNERNLWDQGWSPRVFDATPGDPTPLQDTADAKVRGAKITAWPDFSTTRTQNQVERELFGALRFIAQATWADDVRPVTTYDEFVALSDQIGRAPGYATVDHRPVAAGSYYLLAADGTGLTVSGGTVAAGPAAGSTRLRIEPTEDDYYRLTTDQGACLAMQGGRLWLGAPVEQGLPVAVRTTCAGDNQEKWQLKPVDGGLQLLNATTMMPLTLENRSGVRTLVQQAPDVQAPTVLTASTTPGTPKRVSTTTLTASKQIIRAGKVVVLTAAVTPSDASGRVRFTRDGELLAVVPVLDGKAELRTFALAGQHRYNAVYAGDTRTATSRSTAVWVAGTGRGPR